METWLWEPEVLKVRAAGAWPVEHLAWTKNAPVRVILVIAGTRLRRSQLFVFAAASAGPARSGGLWFEPQQYLKSLN